jgi:hypothetical protein
MTRWEEEEYWDDANEPPRRPAWDDEAFAAVERPPAPGPLRQELEGSVYEIPDPLWGFAAPDREWHPGACARCDPAAGLAYSYKGTDARRVREKLFAVVVVDPTPQNGLKKTTAFALDPRRIPLPIFRKIHNADGWRGALEEECLRRMQTHLERWLARREGAGA